MKETPLPQLASNEISKFEALKNGELKLGTHVVLISTFERYSANHKALFDVIFTLRELADCGGNTVRLSARFAGKKAVKEALGERFDYKDFEIISSESRQPMVKMNGGTTGIVSVSLSHDKDLAVGFAASSSNDVKIGIGVDVTTLSRIAQLREQHQLNLGMVFTLGEIGQCGNDVSELAKRWAAKEAIGKALGTGLWRKGVAWRDIETLSNNGQYSLALTKGAREKADQQGLNRWSLITVNNGSAVLAFVVAQT